MKTIVLLLVVIGFCALALPARAQTTAAGKVDLTFTNTPITRPNAPVVAIGVQTNGQVLIGGNFTQPLSRYGLARLNADGTPDASFLAYVKRNNTLGNPTLAGTINQIVRRPDGGFYIKGLFHAVANVAGFTNLAVLDANGNHDTNFVAGGLDADLLTTAKISVQNDNRILVNMASNLVYRLSLTGSVDDFMFLTNIASISSLAADPNGGFYVAGQVPGEIPLRSRVFRFHADGSPDSNFSAPLFDAAGGSPAYSLDLPLAQADGKVMVNGNYISVGGVQRGGLCRLNTDGTLDTTFVPGASGVGTIYQGNLIGINGIKRLPDGRFIIYREGPFRYDNIYKNGIARISASGALDTTFDPGKGPEGPSFGLAPEGWGIQAATPANDGNVYVGGYFTNFNSTGYKYIARLNAGPVSAKPAIVSNPQSVSVTNGVDVTFTVVASGPGTFSYTWAHNGAVIPGATSASLTITNVDLQDVGAYTVTVINSAGSTAALPAVLTVNGVSVPDLTGPTFKITSPAGTFALVTTNQYDFKGTSTDNQGIALLHYKQDANAWTHIVMNTNWAFTVNLNAGTNIFLITVSDTSGNYAVTQRATVFYFVPQPISVNIVGNGKITGATNGQIFPVGRSVASTATAGTGWLLTNWLVQVNGSTVLSTNKAAPFLTQSNLVLTATFVDITKPLVKVVVPKIGGRWSNDLITVTGTLTDNNPAGTVYCRVNGQGWIAGTGWTNWFCQLDSPPGTNTLDVFAVDAEGNRSLTNTLKFVRVVMWPLGVNIVGIGKLSITNGQLLEIGKSFLPKLTPSTGWILTNWLVTVEGSPVLNTNKLTAFVMRTNTALQATFADITKPVLTITAPVANQKWSNELFTIKGKVADNNPGGEVKYQLNNGGWNDATGWTNWQQDVTLIPGTNILQVYALDAAGNRSLTNTVKFVYVFTYCLADYYYSATLGTRMIFDGTNGDGSAGQLEVKIDDTPFSLDVYSGTTVISNYFISVLHVDSAYGFYNSGSGLFTPTDDWDEYFISADCSFGFMGSDDASESIRVEQGFVFTNRLAVGQTASLTKNFYTNGSYAGKATIKLQLLDVSTVTVPAGNFPGCLRIRQTLTAGGQTQAHDDWLAPGIGMVKQQGVSAGNAAEHWELIVLTEPPSPSPAIIPTAQAASLVVVEPPAIELQGAAIDAASGQFRFQVAGPAGLKATVEVSDDLTHWTPLQTVTFGVETVQITNSITPGTTQRFYRVTRQ